MRYFNYLSREEDECLFYSPPLSFNSLSEKFILAHAVGAALYMPATRQAIAEELQAGKIQGLVSMVLDLEDAVGDHQVEQAEQTLCQQVWILVDMLDAGTFSMDDLPLIFIRVRSPEQLSRLMSRLGEAIEMITGFALPKFSMENGPLYLEMIADYNRKKNPLQPPLYVMPILETPDVIYRESRMVALLQIKHLLDEYQDYVLNVRIGATDFSSLFGLRRSRDVTIYDIGVIRDCITDITNIFGRVECQYVISGPVWEYFKSDRVFKPQLRQTLFENTAGRVGRQLRMQLIDEYADGLIREVAMDKENGILGKTIIHPSHLLPVQSLYVVTHEEYMDALSIIEQNNGLLGVFKSQYANKMNEIKPHLNWAQRIMIRSKVYGVLHEDHNFTSLLVQQDEHERVFL